MQPDQITNTRASLLAAVQNQKQQEANKTATKTEAAKPAAAATTEGPAVLAVLKDPTKLAVMDGHIADLRRQGKTDADIETEINAATSLQPGDKQFLINRFKGLNDVRPGLTMMKDKNGKTINVMNDDTKQWLDQGYTVVGQGTNPNSYAQASSDQGSVIK